MDFSKLKGKIFFQNKFVDSRKAKVHVLNHSLHFASSIFEGIGVYNNKPLFLGEHIDRLFLSADLMRLKVNYSKKKIIEICNKLVRINKIDNGYIRPLIFRSSHSMSPETKNCKSLIAIASWKWGRLFNKSSLSLNISKYPKLNENIYPTQAKSSGSYQISVLERSKIEKTKFDDCLMLDLNKNVAETSACNIFWIKNNIVYTPKKHSILNGVTRRCIIELCLKNKINLKINDYKLKHIMNADSVFMTGTAAEIQVVKNIEKTKYETKSQIIDFLKNKYEILKKQCPYYIKEIRT